MNYDALKYTDRLSVLKFFPTRHQGVAAIAAILLEICLEEQDVERLVSEALKRFDEWPGPASIRKLHAEVIGHPKAALPDGCAACDMSGFRTVFEVIEKLPGRKKKKTVVFPDLANGSILSQSLACRRAAQQNGQDFYEAVAPCTCPLGEFRRGTIESQG